MPVYNGEKFIAEAIDSVIKQTHEKWELLIINDGSTDTSEEIIQSYNDERIIYFKQGNKGVSSARNIGLSNIKGEYFCFLDADDRFTPNSVKDRLNMFYSNTELEFVEGKVVVFDTNTGKLLREYIPEFRGNPLNELVTLSGKCFFGPTWMVKKIEDKHYGFKEGLTHAEDLLFYISISDTGAYDYIDETIYEYRSGSTTAMSNLRMLETGYFAVYNIIKERGKCSKKQSSFYRKKAKTIMFKSYLANGNIWDAMTIVFR